MSFFLFPPVFSYAMDGLSSDKLRMLLHPVDDDDGFDEGAGDGNDGAGDGDDKDGGGDGQMALRSASGSTFDFRDNVVLATLQDGTMGKWMEAQVMYSYAKPHKVLN